MSSQSTPSTLPQQELQQRYPVGELVRCVVERVEAFGVFVRLEDEPRVRGFIHRKNWSWAQRVLELEHSVQPGEVVEARVLGHKGAELTLSRRHASDDPYPSFRRRHAVGEAVIGQVDFLSRKGAGIIVTLDEGVSGFIPRSEIPEPYAFEEGFGVLAGDRIAARIDHFEKDDVVLSIKAHLRAGDLEDDVASSRELTRLRAHPTLGLTLEGMYWDLELDRFDAPQVTPAIRQRIRRVLIVEDNSRVSASLVLVFQHFGFAVDRAGGAEEAVAALAGERYDLLVLDLNLPAVRGVEVLERLGAEPPLVYVLTAAEEEPEALLGAFARSDEWGPFFFRKPATAATLFRHLDAHLTTPGVVEDDRSPAAQLSTALHRERAPQNLRAHAMGDERGQRMEETLAWLARDTAAERAFVLSYQPGPIFELVAGHLPELSREAQQELEISPVGDVIRRRSFRFLTDVSKKHRQFTHLLKVLPISDFAGLGLDYTDHAEYGLFLTASTPGRMQAVPEDRLRLAGLKIANLLAQQRFDQVLTEKQGLLQTGFLADSLLHEIKNELQALDDYAALPLTLIKERDADLSQLSKEEAVEIKRSLLGVQKVSSQLAGLVALFRNLAGRSRLALVDVNASIERLLKTLRPFAADHDTRIITQLDEELPDVEIDPKLLDQPLLNIFVNAIEQMALVGTNRRRLAISTHHRPGADLPVEIRIADSGQGIHAVHREKIFDLFFSTKPDGTGLGLYIARYFIQRLGGRLRLAESLMFSGSEFSIELPQEAPP